VIRKGKRKGSYTIAVKLISGMPPRMSKHW
jgi:hypothetical protein